MFWECFYGLFTVKNTAMYQHTSTAFKYLCIILQSDMYIKTHLMFSLLSLGSRPFFCFSCFRAKKSSVLSWNWKNTLIVCVSFLNARLQSFIDVTVHGREADYRLKRNYAYSVEEMILAPTSLSDISSEKKKKEIEKIIQITNLLQMCYHMSAVDPSIRMECWRTQSGLTLTEECTQ